MRICLRRREFIAGLGGAAVWPVAGSVQRAGKLLTIGFLGASTPAAQSQWTSAFVQRLRELGWTEGRNVAIEYRWGEGRNERYAEIAAEFVRLNLDVIVTSGGAALTLKQATSAIPIVFAASNDPLGSGLVASLARPGGNLTGLSAQLADIAGKRAELLREAVSGMRRLAIMGNAGNSLAILEMGEAQTAARKLGLEAITSGIRRAEDIVPAFDAFKGQAQALYVCGDPLVTTNLSRINTLALGAQLPTMHASSEFVRAGGFMSYGPNFPDLYRRAAEFVDKILRGAKPSDIPVEQPTKFELVVNLMLRRRSASPSRRACSR
jgi:putative ABC transport system substrate-binding protein